MCALVPYLKTVENLKNVSILLHFLHVSGFELWHPLLPVWFWIFHRWRCARIKVSFASSVSVLHFCILVNQKQILIMANDKSNLQRKEDKPLDDGKSLSAFTFSQYSCILLSDWLWQFDAMPADRICDKCNGNGEMTKSNCPATLQRSRASERL